MEPIKMTVKEIEGIKNIKNMAAQEVKKVSDFHQERLNLFMSGIIAARDIQGSFKVDETAWIITLDEVK